MSTRPALDAAALAARLPAPFTGLRVVAETGSTNADLAGSDVGSVLVAEFQTAGRGRLDRTWQAPARSSLTFSVRIRPAVAPAHWSWLPLLAGLALHDVVSVMPGLSAALKWPNDLLIGPRAAKVAGILAQVDGDAVIVGIGLNVSTTADELPVPAATSLALEGIEPDRGALLIEVLTRFGARLARFELDPAGQLADYRVACATIGAQVQVTALGGGVRDATAVGVDAAGRLQVDFGDGIEVLAAGDVHHVRAG